MNSSVISSWLHTLRIYVHGYRALAIYRAGICGHPRNVRRYVGGAAALEEAFEIGAVGDERLSLRVLPVRGFEGELVCAHRNLGKERAEECTAAGVEEVAAC